MALNRLKRGLRATLLGMITNIFLAAGKLAAGIFGHSHALVADAVESFGDIFSSLVVWRGLVVAAEPADANHPYGHGKAEPIATAMVATMLLLAAIGIVVNAVRALLDDPVTGPKPFTLLVLIGVIVIKEGLFRYVNTEAQAMESTVVQADAWHHRSDVYTSLATFVGISISVIGGKKFWAADDIAALLAAAIIGFTGWRLLRPALDELMDAAPRREIVEGIRKIAATTAKVQKVEKCMARKTGHFYFVDMHIEVNPQMTVKESHAIAHAVKDAVREAYPAVRDVLVHIEPGKV